MAEATGVFFYVFPGIASVANLLVNAENPLGAPVFSSFFQIAVSFSLGITFAIVVYVILVKSRIPQIMTNTKVCTDQRRTFQSGNHHLFRDLAGLPVEKGSLLHIVTDLWGIPCWSIRYGNVLAANSRAQGRD
jgi:hypothetical protein